MDTKDIQDEQKEEKPKRSGPPFKKNHTAWRLLAGFFVVLVGCALLLQRMGYFFPWWLFTWPVLLIAIGLFSGLKSGFRFFGSFILIAVGSLFLAQEVFSGFQIERYIWPAVIITIGLGVMFGRHKKCGPWGGPGNPRFRRHWEERMRERWGDEWRQKMEQWRREKHSWREFEHSWRKRSRYNPGASTPDGEVLDVNAVFGSAKRTVLSKNFAGGEINAVLGGAEVDLSRADFNGRVVLEVNSVLGGTRIIVPANWTVISEMDTVFGSLDDHRPTQLLHPDPAKVLVLQGATVFGGTELSVG
jgi:predicted membrane protein